MELKRVLGKDNRQAMEEVLRLYGSDALVVSSHKVNGNFELIVAVDIEADPALIDVPDTELMMDEPKAPVAKVADTSFKKVLHGQDEPALVENTTASHDSVRANEIVELFREEIQVLKREIQETRKASVWHMQMANPQTLTVWQKALMDHPMPSRLKTLLIDSLADIDEPDQAEAQLHAILNEGITSATELPEEISGVHAFFGPSGSGKTTLIGKLARMATDRFSTEQIAVISYADQKIGAWNQMQLMASQWGVQCYRANSPDMLKTVLREVADFECVLIDTSGVDIKRHHAEVSQYVPEALIHLVVPTEISRSSGERLFNEGLVWDSVNVTKLDESNDAWVLLDALLQHTDTQLWLQSASGQLNRPVKLMNTTKWIASIISVIAVEATESQTNQEADIDGRQENVSVSTLEVLTGLRTPRSGGSDTQQEPAF
jgi:flagellar biosynthesis protein FlhF